MTLADLPLTAGRAHEVGLVADLYDTADEVRAAASELAQRIASHSPTAVFRNLRLLQRLARTEANDEVIAEAQRALLEGWADEATAAALHEWSSSQSRPKALNE